MSFFSWSSSISVGVKAADDDHKRLIELLNTLHDAMRSGQGKVILGNILDELVSYTQYHFAREEKFFAMTGFPAQDHKREHRQLTEQVLQLQSRFKSDEGSLSIETLDFLKQWLTFHIQGTDKKYSTYLNAKGIR